MFDNYTHLRKTIFHKMLKKCLHFPGYKLQLLRAIRMEDRPKRFAFDTDRLTMMNVFVRRLFLEKNQHSTSIDMFIAIKFEYELLKILVLTLRTNITPLK